MAGTHNPLLPEMATVIETVQETHNIKTFRVRFDDEEKMKNFTFQPGQVGQLSVFGVGESTFPFFFELFKYIYRLRFILNKFNFHFSAFWILLTSL